MLPVHPGTRALIDAVRSLVEGQTLRRDGCPDARGTCYAAVERRHLCFAHSSALSHPALHSLFLGRRRAIAVIAILSVHQGGKANRPRMRSRRCEVGSSGMEEVAVNLR